MIRFRLFLILLILGAMWGVTVPLTKIAVSTGHQSLGLVFWQFLISTVALYGVTRLRGSKLRLDRHRLPFFLIICITGTLVPNTTSYIAAFHLPGGVMALIIALVPMFSLLIALLVGLENFKPVRMLGILLGAVAIALLVLPESSLPDASKTLFILLALVAPFCYGLEGNYLSVKQPQDTGPVATLFGASLLGTFISLPLSLATDTFVNPFPSGIGHPELALGLSSLFHVSAYVGYIWMVKRTGAVFTAQVAYIVTPAGILLSIIMLGEEPSFYIWAAMGLLLIGLFMVQPRSQTG